MKNKRKKQDYYQKKRHKLERVMKALFAKFIVSKDKNWIFIEKMLEFIPF